MWKCEFTYACNPFQPSDVTNNMNLYHPVAVTQALPTTNNTFPNWSAGMVRLDWASGQLESASEVRESVKTLGQMEGIFANAKAWREMDPNTVVYRVQAWCPVPEGTEGALFWGNTVVEPGKVDSEYFMTHGHFHLKRERAEYYATVAGEGALILMDETRRTWMEPMSSGSLHFIPPNVGHRVANVGSSPLRFVACWPSDAGHNYESIRKHGFGARLMNLNGGPVLVRSAV